MSSHIHIVGAGGPAGVGLTRCLSDHYKVTGHDESPWGELMMECDYAEPWEADMIIPVPDAAVLSRYGDSALSFCPDFEQVMISQDKAKTAEILGDLAPKTYWIRDTKGAGGAGAQMLSNYLPGRNFSVEFVFKDNEEIGVFQKERISYSVKYRTEGIENRGSSMVSICRDNEDVYIAAHKAVKLLAEATKTPRHGFYGVDLKEDENGVFKVTEINAGRLLTASYSYYWLTGYSLPLIGARAFLGEEQQVLPPYPLDHGIIRQTDQMPKLFPPEVTKGWV
jgi:hypothetical protein